MKLWLSSVENESHCDFVKLREMLIRVNMMDLREQTHARHYELYRRCKLEEMGFKDTNPDSEPFRYCNFFSRRACNKRGCKFSSHCIVVTVMASSELKHLSSHTQSAGDICGQEKRIHWWATTQGGADETDVCQQSEGDRSWTKREGERGENHCLFLMEITFPGIISRQCYLY